MNETELAWAAGFFDGEGWSTVQRRKNGLYLQIGVAQKDTRPLVRFAVAVGSHGSIYGPSGTSPCFNWRASKKSVVLEVMAALWPYLSPPKREQFRAVLEEVMPLELPDYPA